MSHDGAPSPETRESMTARRRRIDDIDDAVVQLLCQRREISQLIQRARLSAGGQRSDAPREAAVTEHYRSVLGVRGADLAAAVLRVCRGRS